mgnify:CR=1 FL=1
MAKQTKTNTQMNQPNLFCLAHDDKLIAWMEVCADQKATFGAVIPKLDGNYYSDLVICGDAIRLNDWINWAKKQEISDGFPFKWKNVHIVEYLAKKTKERKK